MAASLTRHRLPLLGACPAPLQREAALELAQSILCAADIPCRSCDQCTMIANGVHPDVLIVDCSVAAGLKDRLHALYNRAQLAPVIGTSTVIIVTNADLLDRISANTLLKLIEEHAAHVFIRLLADSVLSVIATIRSRCAIVIVPQAHNEELLPLVQLLAGITDRTIPYADFLERVKTHTLNDLLVALRRFADRLDSAYPQLQAVAELLEMGRHNPLKSLFTDHIYTTLEREWQN